MRRSTYFARVKSHRVTSDKTRVITTVSTSEGTARCSIYCVGCDKGLSVKQLLYRPLLASVVSVPPDGSRVSDPDETPVEDVKDDEGDGEEDSTATVDPLRDLLGRHRGEAGVVRGGARCRNRNHQVSLARVVFGSHVRVTAQRVYGVHSERVAVILQQQAITLVAVHGTKQRCH